MNVEFVSSESGNQIVLLHVLQSCNSLQSMDFIRVKLFVVHFELFHEINSYSFGEEDRERVRIRREKEQRYAREEKERVESNVYLRLDAL